MKLLRSTALIIFVACLAPPSVSAQISAGLKAGFNLATMNVDDGVAEYGFQTGFQAGAFVDYNLPKVGYQLDVVYSRQGASINANGKDLKLVSTYVNLPIVIKYKIGPSFNIQGGPQVGFLTCMESDYHPVIRESFETQEYTKAYKKVDFGFVLGGGWQSTKGILVDLRYYLGLADISDYEGLESTKNSVIQLTVGYKLLRFSKAE
jgi:hypothetical protein